MKEDVLNKIKTLSTQARVIGHKDIKLNLSSKGTTALSQTIKTKEQAELFMKRLKALDL